MEFKNLDESSIKNALETEKPVLIGFYADWCGGCEEVTGVMTEFASENPDIEIYKINVDENTDIANEYRVMSVPTVLALDKSEILGKAVGNISKEDIKDLFNCL